MEVLPKVFDGIGQVRGVKFTQVYQDDEFYIYERYDKEIDKNLYEVFYRKISKPKRVIIGGVPISFKEKELYPTDVSFGSWAWRCATFQDAIKKIEELKSNNNERINNNN